MEAERERNKYISDEWENVEIGQTLLLAVIKIKIASNVIMLSIAGNNFVFCLLNFYFLTKKNLKFNIFELSLDEKYAK